MSELPTRNTADKSMTIGEVEELKTTLSNTIAAAIKEFEDATGMRVGYIEQVRKRDSVANGTSSGIEYPSNDRGDITGVNVDLDLDI